LQMGDNKAMKTSAVHARIEPQTKEKAEEILRSLGLTPTEAIRIFDLLPLQHRRDRSLRIIPDRETSDVGWISET